MGATLATTSTGPAELDFREADATPKAEVCTIAGLNVAKGLDVANEIQVFGQGLFCASRTTTLNEATPLPFKASPVLGEAVNDEVKSEGGPKNVTGAVNVILGPWAMMLASCSTGLETTL
jgi:hypothetical protein